MKWHCLLLAAAVVWSQASAEPVQGFVDALRGPVAITATTRPPLMGNPVNDDARHKRNYDKQPPVVPHRVDGYQVDKNFNKCLDCHARPKTEFSQAVPVSESHYLDRRGTKLPQVSTRRYFCMQCHVAQEAVPLPVGNTFRGLESTAAKP